MWVKLSDLKNSHPVEVAEYAQAHKIDHEPAFVWRVLYMLKKRKVIVSSMNARVQKTNHKYGIKIPSSVEHSYQIDDCNCNSMWRDALKKEMYNVGVAFEVLDQGVKAPKGWGKVMGHLVWDLKMNFTRKARWVLDGHKTCDPIKPVPLWNDMKVFKLPSSMQLSMDLMYSQPIFTMHIGRHLHCRRITSCVDQNFNRKISMIFPLVSCCSCVNKPSSS